MKTLTDEQYRALRRGASVASADAHGDKVLKLADGSYLKLFRIKRLLTSARIFPYWRRFAQNAARLTELGIPTLQVMEILKLPGMARTAVHYRPLPGQTLRQLGSLDAALAAKLGAFIGRLHDRGVYLRSMHLGNVVLTPDGRLGLIDIADMRIHGRPLTRRLRFRNFHHLCRYRDDRESIARHAEAFVGQFDERLRPGLRRMLEAGG